jgi:pyrimidine-nucleoside phosphorylase
MTDNETKNLTLSMAYSGETVDLSGIKGVKVDKHSTGGVGDKTTLIIGPVCASLGIPIAKMSGRGLGHTGGTVDKLEAIPNFKTGFTKEEFFRIVNSAGICIAGQSGNLAPADKKMYALRDVTATVDSIPLIAASVMSKKIAAGSDAILLDVKTGSGAFMKTLEDAVKLAEEMVKIGEAAGRSTVALITDMDIPLGNAIGNTLEIMEAAQTLKNNGPKDLTEVCISLAAEMLLLSGAFDSRSKCAGYAARQLENGAAFEKFCEMVTAQGGDASYVRGTPEFNKAAFTFEIKAPGDGYISKMDAESCGAASCMLGAGRETEASFIDYSAGLILNAKTGDFVSKGDVIATMYANNKALFADSSEKFTGGLTFSDTAPERAPLIYARVSKDGVVKL